jgi:hypothetical protein
MASAVPERLATGTNCPNRPRNDHEGRCHDHHSDVTRGSTLSSSDHDGEEQKDDARQQHRLPGEHPEPVSVRSPSFIVRAYHVLVTSDREAKAGQALSKRAIRP